MRRINRLIDIFWMPSLLLGLGIFASLFSLFRGHQTHITHPNVFGLLLLALCFLSTNGSRIRNMRLFFAISGLAFAVFRIWWFFSAEISDSRYGSWYSNPFTSDFTILPLNYAIGVIAFLLFQIFEEIYETPRNRRIWTSVSCILTFTFVTIGTLRIFFSHGEGFYIYSLSRVLPLDAIVIQFFTSYYIFKAWIYFYRHWSLYKISLFIAAAGGFMLAITTTGIEKQIHTVIQNQMERKVVDIETAFHKNVSERLSIISIFGDFLNNVPNPTETQIYATMSKLNSSGMDAPAVYFFNQRFELKWIFRDNRFLWGSQAQAQFRNRKEVLTQYLQQLSMGRKYLTQNTPQGLTVSFSSPLVQNKKLAGYLVFEDLIQPRIQMFFSKNDFGPFTINVSTSDGTQLLGPSNYIKPIVFVRSDLDFLGETISMQISPTRQLAINTVLIPQLSFIAVGLLVLGILIYTVYINRKRVLDVEKQVQDRVKELKVLKEEADHAKLSAEHASYAKSQFLANMSHEIRTPLNVLLGASELLSETTLNTEQKKYVEMFQTSGKHLLGLLNDIIDLSRIESGQLETEKISFDLIRALHFVHNLFSLKAQEQGLQFVVDTQNIKHIVRRGDPLRIRQILVNLIGNSFKFTKTGTIKLLVGELDSEVVEFVVEDTGSGIPEDKQKEIFETFQQGDVSFSRKHGGAGLGLAISKNLCELMGGTIQLESTPGVGSKFTVRIPLPVTADTPVRSEPLEETGDVIVDTLPDSSSPVKNLLLVDDSDDNRFLVKLFLENSPYKITEAKNGEEAVDFVKHKPFDIILMDMQMPVMDGYEAVKIIRQFEKVQGEVKKVPILALTAHGTTVEKNKCLEIGCTDYLSKPVSKNTLLHRISDLTSPTQG